MACKALKSMVDGKRTGKRNQTVFTPQIIIDRINLLWGRIYFDNCWAPGALTNPIARACLADGQNGLAMAVLPRKTFTNPPFGQKSRKQLPLGGYKEFLELYQVSPETILLGPVRTHRKWYRKAVRMSVAVCWLDPLRFHEFPQPFPAPLALHYRGPDPDGFKFYFDNGACALRNEQGLGDVDIHGDICPPQSG